MALMPVFPHRIPDLSVRDPSNYYSLTDRSLTVLAWIYQMPWCSVRDLAGFGDADVSSYYPWFGRLEESGLIESHPLSATRRRVARYMLTPEGASVLAKYDGVYHHPFFLSSLLERLPSCEWFYDIAAQLRNSLGLVREFCWFQGQPFDAAALFEKGWVLFFWSGSLQSENRIYRSLERLGRSLAEFSLFSDGAWPSWLCFVVTDRWQRELVFRAAAKAGVRGVRVWCVSDGTDAGDSVPTLARGWIYQRLSPRSLGLSTLAARLRKSPWSEEQGLRGGVPWRLLRQAYEWPLMNISFARRSLGIPGEDSGRWTYRSLRRLYDASLLERSEQTALGGYRYFLSSSGLEALRRQDRVHGRSFPGRAFQHHEGPSGLRARTNDHEAALMDLMARFYAQDLPGATGWRSWESLGEGRGGISPDGLVFLNSGPYGGGWHYVEVERSARGRYRAGRKLRGYISEYRGNDWPVLLVLWSETAERNFQFVGQSSGLRMLTCTSQRLALAKGDPMVKNLWSMYGQRVSLA